MLRMVLVLVDPKGIFMQWLCLTCQKEEHGEGDLQTKQAAVGHRIA